MLNVDFTSCVLGMDLACLCVCGLSSKEIAGTHTHTHMPQRSPPHRRAFPMSCYTDVFPGQEPPSTHSFPYKSCPAFPVFVCLFVLIPTVSYHGFHEATITTSTITFFEIRYRRGEGGEGEKRGGLDWSSRRSGCSSARASNTLIHGPHGRAVFSMSTSLGGVGLLLVFPEISKVTIRVRERKEDTEGERREEKRVCAIKSGR